MTPLREKPPAAAAAASTSSKGVGGGKGPRDDADGGSGPSGALGMLVQAVLIHPYVVPRVLAHLQEKGTGRSVHHDSMYLIVHRSHKNVHCICSHVECTQHNFYKFRTSQ